MNKKQLHDTFFYYFVLLINLISRNNIFTNISWESWQRKIVIGSPVTNQVPGWKDVSDWLRHLSVVACCILGSVARDRSKICVAWVTSLGTVSMRNSISERATAHGNLLNISVPRRRPTLVIETFLYHINLTNRLV